MHDDCSTGKKITASEFFEFQHSLFVNLLKLTHKTPSAIQMPAGTPSNVSNRIFYKKYVCMYVSIFQIQPLELSLRKGTK